MQRVKRGKAAIHAEALNFDCFEPFIRRGGHLAPPRNGPFSRKAPVHMGAQAPDAPGKSLRGTASNLEALPRRGEAEHMLRYDAALGKGGGNRTRKRGLGARLAGFRLGTEGPGCDQARSGTNARRILPVRSKPGVLYLGRGCLVASGGGGGGGGRSCGWLDKLHFSTSTSVRSVGRYRSGEGGPRRLSS